MQFLTTTCKYAVLLTKLDKLKCMTIQCAEVAQAELIEQLVPLILKGVAKQAEVVDATARTM